MSTFFQFTPSTSGPVLFQPTLAGTQYNASILWNVFGERYYLSLTDLGGNQIVFRSVVASGPQIQSVLTWATGNAYAVTATPHNVPIATLANLRISNTGTAYDGNWQALATTPTTLVYPLSVNPNEATPLAGTLSFDENLVAGYIPGGLLVFHFETGAFEYA